MKQTNKKLVSDKTGGFQLYKTEHCFCVTLSIFSIYLCSCGNGSLSPLTSAWAITLSSTILSVKVSHRYDSVQSEENKEDIMYDTEKEHGFLEPGFRRWIQFI